MDEDERRRQKKEFNKTEDVTKFLDGLRISVAPAIAEIRSFNLCARQCGRHESPSRSVRRDPAFVPRKCGIVPPLLEKTDDTDKLKVVWPQLRPVPPYCGSTNVLPFFAPFAKKEPGGAAEARSSSEEDTSDDGVGPGFRWPDFDSQIRMMLAT